ncbi:hypothetical protein ACTJLF_02925, partial [Variovorax sp. 22077]
VVAPAGVQAPTPAPESAPAPDGPKPVSGLKLEPTPAEAPPLKAGEAIVLRLWMALGAALLLAFGATMQWRRGRAAA